MIVYERDFMEMLRYALLCWLSEPLEQILNIHLYTRWFEHRFISYWAKGAFRHIALRKMKYSIVAVGVLACFLASVEAHEFNDAISALKAWTPCVSGEECPPPSPCHEPFSMTKVCVFSAGVGKLLIDPQRRKEVIHSGLTALIRKIRYLWKCFLASKSSFPGQKLRNSSISYFCN